VRVLAFVVDVDDLGEFVVVDDRERQHELTTALRSRFEQVVLGPDGGADSRHDLFPDRVERRVGDLCEQLLEVVEEQTRAAAQNGDRRVGSHRADRLETGLGHRCDDDLQLFVRVSENLLAAQHAGVTEHDVLAPWQVDEFDQSGIQPLLVRVFGSQSCLDLLVGDDPALGHVDQEHLARAEAALLDDVRRIDVDHAGLAGHDNHVVVGDPVPTGPQTVAVQDRSDDRAIGEGNAGRAVPWLHHR
jgi:hypothetical protein